MDALVEERGQEERQPPRVGIAQLRLDKER